MFEIPQYVYTVLIIVTTVIATLITITAPEKIYHRGHGLFKQSKYFNRLVFFTLLAGAFTILKDVDQSRLDKIDKKEAKSLETENNRVNDSLRKASDSLSTANADRTIGIFSDAIGKYGLKLTKENEIIKAKIDSSKKGIAPPELFLENVIEEKSQGDSLRLRVYFKSLNQPSLNTTINMYLILAEPNGKATYVNKFNVFNEARISSGNISSNNIVIPFGKSSLLTYFVAIGKYYDDKNKSYVIKDIYFYNRNLKVFGQTNDELKRNLIEFARSHNIQY